jgi:ATP-dependent Lon protease
MEKQQKESLLRQQLAAVRKALNELTGSGAGTEEDDYRARVEAVGLPEKVRETALKEVGKLERTPDSSPETGWIRTWLDTILDIPWNERIEDAYDIAGARRALDEDHTGLDDVKKRIVEYLAVRKRRSDKCLGVIGGRRSGAVLALVGPPGVGKTSHGESVARATDRKFVRVALGGVRDEAEIRGHRRTYVGALPGRIVWAIREAGTMNPSYCWTRSTRSALTTRATRWPRCSRCWTRRRTTRSATTTWTWTWTCPTWSSWPRPTCPNDPRPAA